MAAKSLKRRGAHARLLAYLPSILVVVVIVSLAGVGWYGFIVPASTQAAKAPPAGALPTAVTVTASEWAFAASTNELATNTTISVTFINQNSIAHTFTLSSVQGVAIDKNTYGSDVGSYFVNHPAYANVQLDGVGQTTINFTAPAFGWYEFVCNISGHFGLGMYSAFGFGMPAPANLTGGGSTVQVGWPVYVIAGTIVALVVLALVLGFVSGQRKGSMHEMPPERLGYPEEVPAPSGTGPHAPGGPLPPGPPPTAP